MDITQNPLPRRKRRHKVHRTTRSISPFAIVYEKCGAETVPYVTPNPARQTAGQHSHRTGTTGTYWNRTCQHHHCRSNI
ncbi:MAG: hypothetical protein MJ014_01870 [Methanocorpusculum sp.]|nr:hypothetical protein [Methanocorpusculum sp.]